MKLSGSEICLPRDRAPSAFADWRNFVLCEVGVHFEFIPFVLFEWEHLVPHVEAVPAHLSHTAGRRRHCSLTSPRAKVGCATPTNYRRGPSAVSVSFRVGGCGYSSPPMKWSCYRVTQLTCTIDSIMVVLCVWVS